MQNVWIKTLHSRNTICFLCKLTGYIEEEETWTLSCPHHTFQEKVKEVLESPPSYKVGTDGDSSTFSVPDVFSNVDGAS